MLEATRPLGARVACALLVVSSQGGEAQAFAGRVPRAAAIASLFGQAPPAGATGFSLDPSKLRARARGRSLVLRGALGPVLITGHLHLRVKDLRGRVRGQITVPVTTSLKPRPLRVRVPLFAAPTRRLDLWRLSWRFVPVAGKPSAGIVGLSEIVGVPFLTVRGQTQLVAGSQAALRITVQDARARPLPRAPVSAWLHVGGRRLLARGEAGPDGVAHLALDIPDRWAGRRGRMILRTRAGPFPRAHRERITIRRAAQALLTTDKPLYQPGQTVHLRVLAVRQPSRRPLVGRPVRFRLRDPRDTLLAEQEVRTDAFGVAWTALPLSAGLRPGTYALEAEVATDAGHAVTRQRSVRVYRYQVPDFKVSVLSRHSWARLGRPLKVTVRARYLSGQPVPRARVSLAVRRVAQYKNGRYGRKYEMDLGEHVGRTDAQGAWTVRLPLQARHLRYGPDQMPNALQLRAHVEAPGGMRQKSRLSLPLAYSDLQIGLYPEAGKLIRGVPQRLILQTARPDGTPVRARLTVSIPVRHLPPDASALRDPADRKRRKVRLRTDARGLATLPVQPRDATLSLSVTARDDRGQRASRSVTLRVDAPRMLVRPEPAVAQAGQVVRLHLWRPTVGDAVQRDAVQRDAVQRDAVQRDAVQRDAVQRDAVQRDRRKRVAGKGAAVQVALKQGSQTLHTASGRLEGPRGTLPVRIPADVDGLLSVMVRTSDARQGSPTGHTPLLVRPTRWLRVRVRSDRSVYAPGAPARLAVRVTDEQGRPRRAAVGLRIVDEGVYHLAGKRVRSEHGELLLPAPARGEATPVGGWTLARLMRDPRARVPARVARVLLSRLQRGRWHPAPDELVHDGTEDVPAYRRALGRRLTQRLRGWFGRRFAQYARAQRKRWRALIRGRRLCQGEQILPDRPQWLVKNGDLPEASRRDPWGRSLRWTLDRREGKAGQPDRYRVTVASSGPDGAAGNADDPSGGPWWLTVPRARRNPNCAVAYGSGALGFGVGRYKSRRARVFMSRASVSGALPGAGAPGWLRESPRARVRRDFRETLAVFPDLRTDARGRTRMTLAMADNLTTWAITALASDRQGRLGGRVTRIRTHQPFSVDVRLPSVLTRGDVITARVVVRSDLPRAQLVQVSLAPGPWYEVVPLPDLALRLRPGDKGPRLQARRRQHASAQRVRTVGPKDVAVLPFRLRVKAQGQHRLTVRARTPRHADAAARVVEVEAPGVAQWRSRSGLLASARALDLTLPRERVPGTTALEVSVEPSVLAATLGSFEGLLRRPYGCFEQTSATTYPNLMVLRHLRQGRGRRRAPAGRSVRFGQGEGNGNVAGRGKGQQPGEAGPRDKARAYLAQGYQRLTTFEVGKSGGFSLFGRAPSKPLLTAFGLGEFHDLSTVMRVDRRLIRRIQRYLLSRQRSDGTWSARGGLIESGDALPRGTLTATAYMAFQLLRSGARGSKLEKALAVLRRQAEGLGDHPYARALCIRALAVADRPADRGRLKRWARRLAEAARELGAQRYWSPAAAGRTLSGRGSAAAQETTALALLALLETRTRLELVPGAVKWLVAQRGARGAWSTTQATVLALEALLAARSRVAGRTPKAVQVELDGETVGRLCLERGGAASPVRLHLPRRLSPGPHRVRLVPRGGGKALYRVALAFNAQRVPAASIRARSGVDFSVTWSAKQASKGEVLQVRATIENRRGRALDAPMLELGIPGGLRLLQGTLRRLVQSGRLASWERRGSRLLLYFTRLPVGRSTLRLRLQAEYPLAARIPPSRMYEYYQPEVSWYAPAGRIVVK
jgi:hypothetical protein